MRARNLKPSFFKNEELGSADPLFGIIFQGLWCLADREGRLEDRPLRIHVEVNPYRDSASTVQALDWLVSRRFVTRYEAGGVRYLEINNFARHQQPHIKEAPSKIPPPKKQELTEAPCEHRASTERAALIPDSPFLISDSPNPQSRAAPVPEDDEALADVPRGTLAKIRDCYPPGLYGDNDWLLAEREISGRLAQGVAPADLVGAAAAYAAQQEAIGKAGTQFITSPSRFFAKAGKWRGPFPLPAKAETAMDRLQRMTAAPTDDRVIEHGQDFGKFLSVG